jgi:NAD(P)-dependent dehydrogenase (short-subunit alcohol dehydrogenase family)
MPTMSSISSHANLPGQYALVPGASSGIGPAIALRFGRVETFSRAALDRKHHTRV